MPYFDGRCGRIFHDRTLLDGPVRCAVIVLHGYGEHLGLYDPLARRLAADGHAVHAMDAVGHGRSDGVRAVIASWDHYVDDARTLVGLVRAQHPGSPLVVVGHSGGALAAALLALRDAQAVDALVLSGGPLLPLEWIEDELALGAAETDVGDPREWMSTHPDYVHALLHDPLTWKGGFRRETLLAVAETWPEVATGLAAGRPALPVLVVHGEADPVVPVEHARRVAEQLPRAALRTLPGDLHDVLNEHDRDRVHDVIATFVGQATTLIAPAASVDGPRALAVPRS
jgi:alpha-beta hydrolase superfamily lysophospholipase